MKATPKKELVKNLGRSPDRGDAVILACWEPMVYRMAEDGDDASDSDDDAPNGGAISPYEGTLEPYGGGLSPYGGGAGQDPDE